MLDIMYSVAIFNDNPKRWTKFLSFSLLL